MHILHVVGARPNFMKAAPVMRALAGRPDVRQSLVHTGQHYDANMSDVFFEQLAIPEPDVNLGVGSGSHARQTAEIMTRIEPVLLEHMPDKVIVYGDVNSTVAAALVSAKLQIEVVHVEAGLRSFDRTMPEEVNRIVTDRLADVLFTPSGDADSNLLAEGVEPGRIHNVGNVMIDSLARLLPAAAAVPRNGLPDSYALVTLHRPSNVDDDATLVKIIERLQTIGADLPVVFPVHPRTRQRLAAIHVDSSRLRLMDPLPYIEFVALEKSATVVITDSGGIQEETTWLGVPCLTMRDNTERPITVERGTNVLVGRSGDRLLRELDAILRGEAKKGTIPPLWDGHAGERIADALCAECSPQNDRMLAVGS
jgi:UDP-N-acetylglucosamine 2-epimerase (non-hydrolysing)